MKVPATETFISRKDAIRQLSRIRYPAGNQEISSPTLHRWRNLANCPATKYFNAEQFGRLCRIAALAFQGLTYEQIALHLGTQSHDSTATAQTASSTAGTRPTDASIPDGLEFLYRH